MTHADALALTATIMWGSIGLSAPLWLIFLAIRRIAGRK